MHKACLSMLFHIYGFVDRICTKHVFLCYSISTASLIAYAQSMSFYVIPYLRLRCSHMHKACLSLLFHIYGFVDRICTKHVFLCYSISTASLIAYAQSMSFYVIPYLRLRCSHMHKACLSMLFHICGFVVRSSFLFHICVFVVPRLLDTLQIYGFVVRIRSVSFCSVHSYFSLDPYVGFFFCSKTHSNWKLRFTSKRISRYGSGLQLLIIFQCCLQLRNRHFSFRFSGRKPITLIICKIL